MRISIVLFLLIVVAVSGCTAFEPTREEIVYCAADADCVCGNIIGKDQCYVGNIAFIEPSDTCFSTCFSDTSKKARCINNECEWVSTKQGEPDFPVAELVHEGIKEGKNVTAITVKNIGPVPFSSMLNLVIMRNNLTIYDKDVQYDMIGLDEFQIKYIPIPWRNITGEWVYNLTLYHNNSKVIKNVLETHEILPPPMLNGFMVFHIKPRYLYLDNITVGVKNTGNITFVPVVQMTIYESDMESMFSVSNMYPSLEPGSIKETNFVLPTIENKTYYFNFIMSENQNKTIMEEITHEVLVGTW